MRKRTAAKVIATLLTMAIAISAVGCGGGNSGGSSGGNASPAAAEPASGGDAGSAAAEPASTEEPVTLRFVTWQTQSKDLDQKVADAYHELHPNITVEYDYYGDMTVADYHTKVDLMVLGNEEMDILMDGSFKEHALRAGSGTYLPVEEYFTKEGTTPEDEYAIVSRVNGEFYGIPGDLKSWFVMINKDYLDEAGLPVPSLDWTWDDYRDYASKLTVGEGTSKRYGSYFHTWNHWFVMGMWSTCDDNPMLKADGSQNFDDPLFKEWLQYRYDLEQVDKSQVPLADVKSLNMNYRDKFFKGEIAMIPIGNYMIPELDDQDKYPHDFVTTFAPIPAWKDNAPGSAYTECLYYSISKTSKHPQEAYDYIRYYTTEGMKMRGMSISAEKDVDRMEFVNAMIEDPKYFDLDALQAVITNPAYKDIVYTNVPVYSTELENMVADIATEYLLGNASLDDTVQKIIDETTKMIAEEEAAGN